MMGELSYPEEGFYFDCDEATGSRFPFAATRKAMSK
jgi:hypothetical protein